MGWVVHNSDNPIVDFAYAITNSPQLGDVNQIRLHNLNTLNLYELGSGFSSVYDTQSGMFLGRPSDASRALIPRDGIFGSLQDRLFGLSQGKPPYRVPRNAGHRRVAEQMEALTGRIRTNFVGFGLAYVDDGVFRISWNSGQLNRAWRGEAELNQLMNIVNQFGRNSPQGQAAWNQVRAMPEQFKQPILTVVQEATQCSIIG